MQSYLNDKSKQSGVSGIFCALLCIMIIMAYFQPRFEDAACFAGYLVIAVYSIYCYKFAKNNEQNSVLLPAIGLTVIALLNAAHSIISAQTVVYVNIQSAIAYISAAVTALYLFIFVDVIFSNKNYMQRVWYLIGWFLLILLPAVLFAFFAFQSKTLFENANLHCKVLFIWNVIVALFAFVSLVYKIIFCVLKRKQKQTIEYCVWVSLLFSCLVLFEFTVDALRVEGVFDLSPHQIAHLTDYVKHVNLFYLIILSFLAIGLTIPGVQSVKKKK